jgi:hypothetical protein
MSKAGTMVHVPRSRAMVPVPPVHDEVVMYWGSTKDHPLLGDILVKPTPSGYEVVGACETCHERVNIRLGFAEGENIGMSASEALKQALKLHPTPPEPFNPGFRGVKAED